MTIVITNRVPDRVRGFLASCMGEIAPGVYVSPKMTPSVRDRIWRVMEEWHQDGGERSVIMLWPDFKEPGGLSIQTLGAPRYPMHKFEDMFLVQRPLSAANQATLEATQKRVASEDGV